MPTGPQNENWGAVMEVKDDRWNHTGGRRRPAKVRSPGGTRDGCPLTGTANAKWPLLQSNLLLEGPFDTGRMINSKQFVTSKRNVRKMTLVGMNVLLELIYLHQPRYSRNTHMHAIVNPYAKVIEPNSQYTHTRESLKCQGSNCLQW